MTFAHYVPANYGLKAFRAKKLDYAKHECPIELWGKPANVVAGVAQHNAALRELAAQHGDVVFVDQHALLPKSAQCFDDCCHLTETGCRMFVENVVQALAPR